MADDTTSRYTSRTTAVIFPSRSSYHSTVFFFPATSQKPFSLFGNPRIWTRCLKTGKALFWAAVFLLSSNTLLNISLLIPPFCGPVITISFFSHTFGTIYLSIRLSFFFGVFCFGFWTIWVYIRHGLDRKEGKALEGKWAEVKQASKVNFAMEA